MTSGSARWISPLRYPGGKARMASWFGEIVINQWGILDIELWIEPFAGGGGAGLALLDAGDVEELWLTEKHPALAAFWRCVCADPEQFAQSVLASSPTMATWDESQEILAAAEQGEHIADPVLGFAAFFINRTSRSGIVAPRVGPIGGRRQTGKWTIASRYNSEGLAERVRRVGRLAPRIRFHEGDALDVVTELDGSVGLEEEAILLLDPPYVTAGERLYTHGFALDDHHRLAGALSRCAARWILTYDQHPLISDVLYRDNRILSYSIPYTANRQRIAREFAVFSDNVGVNPATVPLRGGDAFWVSSTHASRETS